MIINIQHTYDLLFFFFSCYIQQLSTHFRLKSSRLPPLSLSLLPSSLLVIIILGLFFFFAHLNSTFILFFYKFLLFLFFHFINFIFLFILLYVSLRVFSLRINNFRLVSPIPDVLSALVFPSRRPHEIISREIYNLLNIHIYKQYFTFTRMFYPLEKNK